MRLGRIVFLAWLTVSAVFAQSASRGQMEVRGVTGISSFIDESFLHHFVGGGSLHYYVTDRFSVGPELLYMHRDNTDTDITATAQFAWDFLGGPRVQPYVAGNVGVLRHFAPRFAVNSWTYGGGIGVKIALTKRLYLVPDFRIGLEPTMRATVGVSYVIGR